MPVWPTIERFITEHGSAVLVTLAEAQGSSPREAGARMVVRPDGAFSGTIGGGALEWIALAEAQAMLARAQDFRRLDKALGPDLGQCCGGRVRLTLERFDPRDRADVAALASAERAGRFVTVASADDGKASGSPRGNTRRGQDIRRCRLHEAARRTYRRALRRRPDAALFVWCRSRRSCAGAGTGAPAVRGDLDRSASGCIPGAYSRATSAAVGEVEPVQALGARTRRCAHRHHDAQPRARSRSCERRTRSRSASVTSG